MQRALEMAREAFNSDEVPVGCVITDSNGKIIASGKNRMNEKSDACSHAEIEAIRMAEEVVGDWRLDGCTLYVNLEPCPMCAGAIINTRISTIVFGARDYEKGACGGVIDLFSERFPHKPMVYSNVLSDESEKLLKEFFKQKR